MTMVASLRRPAATAAAAAAKPLLDPRGARIVLGASSSAWPAVPITPSANSLFGPRGVCFAGDEGPLIVADTGHHRLLIWRRLPPTDNVPADLVIGQPGFTIEGRNGSGEIGPATLNVPTGVATDGRVLAVADAWNHRVLLWHEVPRTSNQQADVVLGQLDFRSGQPNRGMLCASAATLNWCYGVAIENGRLLVADTGNRRVLVWNRIPETSGAPADLVLGQMDFAARDESAGGGMSALGMRWPHAIAAAGDTLFVADAGSSRIMVWRRWPEENGTPCDFMLGQPHAAGGDHNRGAYDPTAATLNMPYGLAVQKERLVVADTANSRLLGFDRHSLSMGAPAAWLSGQDDFARKGDNGWGTVSRRSVCWPYGVAVSGRSIAIADSGNNRVLFWDAA